MPEVTVVRTRSNGRTPVNPRVVGERDPGPRCSPEAVDEWGAFRQWCTARGLEPLPADPSTVVRYLNQGVEAGASRSSMLAAVAAISAQHWAAALVPSPIGHPSVRSAMRTVLEVWGRERAAAFTRQVQEWIVWGGGAGSPDPPTALAARLARLWEATAETRCVSARMVAESRALLGRRPREWIGERRPDAVGGPLASPAPAGGAGDLAGPFGGVPVGPLMLVPTRAEVRGPQGTVRLTPTEWRLLLVLVRSAGAVLDRSTLATRVWGGSDNARANQVEVCVSRLRRRLRQAGASGLVETVRGSGYRLLLPPGAGGACDRSLHPDERDGRVPLLHGGAPGGPLVLLPIRLTVRGRRRAVTLTPTEWRLLMVLIHSEGTPLDRSTLASRVWGSDGAARVNAVEVVVSRLRRKLAEAGSAEVVETVRGLGYRIRLRSDAAGDPPPRLATVLPLPRRNVEETG